MKIGKQRERQSVALYLNGQFNNMSDHMMKYIMNVISKDTICINVKLNNVVLEDGVLYILVEGTSFNHISTMKSIQIYFSDYLNYERKHKIKKLLS